MDVSNYTGALSPATLSAWKSLGVTRVIVQALDPPPGYPAGVTRQQIQAAQAAGLEVEAYVYLWTAAPGDLPRHLALLDGLGIRRVWLDAEDTTAASAQARIAAIEDGLRHILTHTQATTGIYTGRWWWTAYVANTTEFSALPLWASIYDGDATLANGYVPFGGWTEVTIKQYAGSSHLAGIGGVDLNVY